MRKPIDDADSLALMEEHGVGYSSTGLVARMRANGNTWQEGVRSRVIGTIHCQADFFDSSSLPCHMFAKLVARSTDACPLW